MTLHWAGASGLPLSLLGVCFGSLGLTLALCWDGQTHVAWDCPEEV